MNDQKRRISRWTATPILGLGVFLAHGMLPREIGRRSRHHGWSGERPGRWNLGGAAVIAVGLAGIVWALAQHYARAPQGWALQRTPVYLLSRGPYRRTRNPMYVAEIILWLGWALYYGSVKLLAAAAIFWSFLNFIAVPYEEGMLEARFGKDYRQYLRSTPRWV